MLRLFCFFVWPGFFLELKRGSDGTKKWMGDMGDARHGEVLKQRNEKNEYPWQSLFF